MYERVGAIGQEVRALSYQFPVPIICPTQFNTDGFACLDKEPGMENIAESRAVAHHADAITAIWQCQGEREAGILSWKNLKNRFGGKIGTKHQLKIDYQTLKITTPGTIKSAGKFDLSENLLNI